MRRRSALIDSASPPPSPIPTGKGSRSASNEAFARFLDRSARIPTLSLPGANDDHLPAKVDLSSIDQALGSARDFGVFRVVGHGIAVEELAAEDKEWEGVMGGLGERKCWLLGSRNHHPSPSENVKNFGRKLEEIAEQITQILLRNNAGVESDKKSLSEGSESVLSLYRFDHKNFMEKNQLPLTDEIENEMSDQIYLSLHIPFELCQIYVQSEEDHFSFDAGPETLVVSIGKKIEDLSHKEFKCVPGKMIFVPSPEVRRSQDYSFSVELKFTSSSSFDALERNFAKVISIGDQIIIAIVLTILYKIFMFLI